MTDYNTVIQVRNSAQLSERLYSASLTADDLDNFLSHRRACGRHSCRCLLCVRELSARTLLAAAAATRCAACASTTT